MKKLGYVLLLSSFIVSNIFCEIEQFPENLDIFTNSINIQTMGSHIVKNLISKDRVGGNDLYQQLALYLSMKDLALALKGTKTIKASSGYSIAQDFLNSTQNIDRQLRQRALSAISGKINGIITTYREKNKLLPKASADEKFAYFRNMYDTIMTQAPKPVEKPKTPQKPVSPIKPLPAVLSNAHLVKLAESLVELNAVKKA